MIRRHPILFCLLLLIIGGIVASVMLARRPKLTPVRVAKVETIEKLEALVNASGEIRAHELVDIQAEVAGVMLAQGFLCELGAGLCPAANGFELLGVQHGGGGSADRFGSLSRL